MAKKDSTTTNTPSRTNAPDADRTRMDLTHDRESRGAEDKARTDGDGTILTMAEREAMLRNEFAQEALPKPPKIPGWHTCWLSTTNSYDPIHKRVRIGYVPVKFDEVHGMDQFAVKEGEWAGHVSCNEMVLFKVPDDIYQSIMTLSHHTMPMEEEAKIKEQLKNGPTGADKKTDMELDEGFRDLAVAKRAQFDPN